VSLISGKHQHRRDLTGFYELSSPSGPIVRGFIRSAKGIITTIGNTAQTGDPASFRAQPVAIKSLVPFVEKIK
jgi:hypothetical protein